MKKFRFSLETVLDYKQQALDALQVEHGAILAQVKAQEAEIQEMEAAYRHLNGEFARRKLEGITIVDAMKYDQYLRAMELLKQQAEEKRQEVVEAKKETSSIEKLREKKLDGYNKALQKSEEAMIDELVSTKRVMAAQSA